jgi:hypothetical protein
MDRKSFVAGCRLPTASLLALMAAGCSSIGGTYSSFDVNDGSGAILSADKRAILVWENVKVQNGAEEPISRNVVACAEPQPDAMRAVAQELSAAIKATVNAQGPAAGVAGANGTGSAALSSAASEAVASLGKRTPTVQLMRDALYRTCEGVANGVLGTQHVQLIASRIDNLMLGLHAIDGLTGMHATPATAIGTVVGAGTSGKAAETGTETTTVPLNVNLKIESPTAASPNLETISAEVRKIVAISLLDRFCPPDNDSCAKEQRELVRLAFGGNPGQPAASAAVAERDQSGSSANVRQVTRLARD